MCRSQTSAAFCFRAYIEDCNKRRKQKWEMLYAWGSKIPSHLIQNLSIPSDCLKNNKKQRFKKLKQKKIQDQIKVIGISCKGERKTSAHWRDYSFQF